MTGKSVGSEASVMSMTHVEGCMLIKELATRNRLLKVHLRLRRWSLPRGGWSIAADASTSLYAEATTVNEKHLIYLWKSKDRMVTFGRDREGPCLTL